MAIEVGSRIAHYNVTALIGEGGMAQVYKATDISLSRQVDRPAVSGSQEEEEGDHTCQKKTRRLSVAPTRRSMQETLTLWLHLSLRISWSTTLSPTCRRPRLRHPVLYRHEGIILRLDADCARHDCRGRQSFYQDDHERHQRRRLHGYACHRKTHRGSGSAWPRHSIRVLPVIHPSHQP